MISVRERYYGRDNMTGTTLRSIRTIGQLKQRRPTEIITVTGISATLAEFGGGTDYDDLDRDGHQDYDGDTENEHEYEMQDFQEKRGF